MGMAASQARYLALTARKTNTEWEGQQINQARTALANQSAGLFNRLLSMEVPNPPKTTDYTELQYSYSDGQNEAVIEDWKQLSTSDPNYNYVVNHYYYANVYTGARKYLQDPQIQTREDVQYIDYNKEAQEQGEPAPVVSYDPSTNSYMIKTYDGKEYTYTNITSAQVKNDKNLENSLRDVEVAKDMAKRDGVLTTDGVYGYQDSAGVWHFFLEKEIEEPKDYSTKFVPSMIGNCPVTELTEFDDQQATALAQILRDSPEDSNIRQYLSFDKDGKLVYEGKGVYTFDMQGQTYYTTEKDLLNSLQSQHFYEKPIDVQQEKLAYYNASFVKTKIEKQNQALLETDGEGRFKSVKFDDDSVTYTLNVETVTNEKAYEDAMNQYLYKKEQYEKTIADINAKTEIIQQEDRTLELRLKQLDTEQNALSVEMDAVKKVIKDNVDKTFKTFSD